MDIAMGVDDENGVELWRRLYKAANPSVATTRKLGQLSALMGRFRLSELLANGQAGGHAASPRKGPREKVIQPELSLIQG